MSLLDQLGAAATAVGQGVVDAAKWGYGQTAGPQEAAYQKSVLDRQQASAQAAQDRQDQQDLFRAAQDGWVPADSQKRLPGGLIDRTQPSSANQDPSRIQVIGGKRMYNPTDQEKGKSFVPTGQLGDALKTAGWDGKTPVTPEQSHSVMQALNEAQPKDEPYEYDASGKYLDAKTGKPVPGFIGKKSKKFFPVDLSGGDSQPSSPGAVPGGPFDTSDDPGQPGMQSGAAPANGAAPGGPFSFAPPEKADKPPKSLHFETHTNDKGDVTTFGYDPETMELKSTHVAKGVGPQRKDPTDPNAPKPMSGANARQIVQSKAKALKDAQAAYTKETSEAITDDDRAKANSNLRNAQQQAQLNYESELSAATGNEIPHNPWADVGADTPVRPKDATATAAKTQTRVQQPAQPVGAQPAPAAKAATGAPGAVEGTIIHNKANPKVRMILKGGQWKTLAP